MTAHRPKPTITHEVVEMFTRYLAAHPGWGIIHSSFGDSNWSTPSAPPVDGYTDTELDVAIAAVHDALTPSQRRRLYRKATQ